MPTYVIEAPIRGLSAKHKNLARVCYVGGHAGAREHAAYLNAQRGPHNAHEYRAMAARAAGRAYDLFI